MAQNLAGNRLKVPACEQRLTWEVCGMQAFDNKNSNIQSLNNDGESCIYWYAGSISVPAVTHPVRFWNAGF